MLNTIENKNESKLKVTVNEANYLDEKNEVVEQVMYNITEDYATLRIAKGNSKIGRGIYSFSTLPGNDKYLLRLNKTGELLTNIPGTCSKHCDGCFNGGCYAVRDAKLHHNVVIKAWGENTLLLRNGKLWGMLEDFISYKNRNLKCPGIKKFRINVSGEIQNKSELDNWATIARNHPEVKFGIYTKNYEALAEYFDDCMQEGGVGHPLNFIINVSEWHGVAKAFIDKYSAKYPNIFNVFIYDDSRVEGSPFTDEEKAELKAMVRCPAVTEAGRHAKDANGKPICCDQCGRCYGDHGLGIKTRVPSH